MKLKYYHNPRCSKSREGLLLLENEKVPFETILYLEAKLKISDFEEITKKYLKQNPKASVMDLIRKKEEEYKSLRERPEESDLLGWSKVLAKNPKLLERPLLVGPKAVIIGRPPQDILSSPDLKQF